MLKELLPLLGSHIHDTSERVRIALLELLILVKNMRAIKVHMFLCACVVYMGTVELARMYLERKTISLLLIKDTYYQGSFMYM